MVKLRTEVTDLSEAMRLTLVRRKTDITDYPARTIESGVTERTLTIKSSTAEVMQNLY